MKYHKTSLLPVDKLMPLLRKPLIYIHVYVYVYMLCFSVLIALEATVSISPYIT